MRNKNNKKLSMDLKIVKFSKLHNYNPKEKIKRICR